MNTAKNTAELKPKTKAKRKPSFDVATTVEDKQREEQQEHQEEKEQQGHAAAMRLTEVVPGLWHVAGFMLRWLLSNLPDNHK
ncbi:hypothetical protein ACLKA6_005480 [Drosophila palustris]